MTVPPVAGVPGENDGDLSVVVHDLPHRRFIVEPQGVDGLTYDLGNGSDSCEGESSRYRIQAAERYMPAGQIGQQI